MTGGAGGHAGISPFDGPHQLLRIERHRLLCAFVIPLAKFCQAAALLVRHEDLDSQVLQDDEESIPLSTVIEFISQDLKTMVTLIGIQPENAIECEELSDREKAGVSRLLVIISRTLGGATSIKK